MTSKQVKWLMMPLFIISRILYFPVWLYKECKKF